MKVSKDSWKFMVLVLIVGLIGIFYVRPEFVAMALEFSRKVIEILGMIGFFLILLLQSIVSPIPSEAILALGGYTFGWVDATFVGTMGLMAGAILCYYIAVFFGRPIVERFVEDELLMKIDKYVEKWGAWIVAAGRMLPFIPFDAVSYASGLSKMSLATFLISTFIGTVPRAIFYTYIGWEFGGYINTAEEEKLRIILLVLGLVIITAGIIYFLFSKWSLSRIFGQRSNKGSRSLRRGELESL
ncbi:hypothetical protein DRN93_00780 [archaeon]|nr:MAG: hypothetical protein DRN93_00780 [archaeon]